MRTSVQDPVSCEAPLVAWRPCPEGLLRVVGSRKRIYDAEFREGAVRIVTETGKSIPEVAEELGVHPGTLHSWVSRAKRNGSSSDTPVQASAGAGSGGRLREGERASWSGCGPRPGRRTSASASWRWSVMCASDSWPCG
ncbi:transposase [Streptomyces sp. NBC_01619]|uniref:Transposase n=2 Tax=Streptomyces TaxID=1883 RepID=A0ACC6QB47_9ACTN|nr:transposase [Streptomyces sp. NBC_01619]